MRRSLVFATILLAGCGDRDGTQDAPPISIKTEEGGAINAADGKLSVVVPGLDAKLSLPDFKLGSEDMDIDGMKLAPGSKVIGITIDPDKGVSLGFSNAAPPAAVLDHYRKAGADAGFAVANAAGGLRLTKAEKAVLLALSPDGPGSRGSLVVHDR
jgi:hypothetical protein